MSFFSSHLFSEWIKPGVVVGVIPLLVMVFRGLCADLKEAIKASEARQEKQMDALKEATQALGDKFDRVLEGLLAAKSSPPNA